MTEDTVGTHTQNEKLIRFSILVTFLMFSSQLVGGFITNSLAIMSDAWHLLSDLLALFLSWYAIKQTLKPADAKHTYGYHRFGSLAALINGLTLICISVFISYHAIVRIINPSPVHSTGMMWLALVGFVGTFLIVIVLRQGGQNINVRSALIHFLGDVLSYLGILIGGLVIKLTGWMLVDPILSGLFALIILKNAWLITKEAAEILLEAVPGEVSVEEVKERLLQEEDILNVLDLHIWSLSNEHISLSAHIQIHDMSVKDTDRILRKIEKVLLDEFKIAHTTIQLQTNEYYHNQSKDTGALQVH